MGTWWDPHDNIVRCPRKCPWHVYPPRTMVFYTIMIVLPPRIVAKYYFMHVHGMTAEVLCGCGDDRAKQLQRNWGSGITFVTWANFPYWRWIRELTIYRPRTDILYDVLMRVCVRRCFFGPYTWAWGDSSAVLCVWWWRGYSNWGEGITILTWANFPYWRRIRERTIYRLRTDVHTMV